VARRLVLQRRLHRHLDLDVGPLAVEVGQARDQQVAREGRRRAHAQARRRRCGAGALSQLREFVEGLAHAAQVACAGRAEPHTAG
jgi:hypothetical protein